MIDGFDFKSPGVSETLTGRMELLQRYNGIAIPKDYFPESMERLIKRFLSVPLDTVLHPVSSETNNKTHQMQHQATLAAGSKPNWKEIVSRNSFNSQQTVFNTNREAAVKLMNRGVARHESGDRTGALNDFDEAIRLDDKQALHFSIRGTCKLNLGDKSGAEKDFRRALSLDSKCITALEGVGIIHLHRGMFGQSSEELRKAISCFSEVIHLDQNRTIAYRWRAETFNELGNSDAGLKDVESYLQHGGERSTIEFLESELRKKGRPIRSVLTRLFKGDA